MKYPNPDLLPKRLVAYPAKGYTIEEISWWIAWGSLWYDLGIDLVWSTAAKKQREDYERCWERRKLGERCKCGSLEFH